MALIDDIGYNSMTSFSVKIALRGDGEDMQININNDDCNLCGHCITVCPAEVYTWSDSTETEKYVKVINQELCIKCGHCVAICPKEAVLHDYHPNNLFLPLDTVDISTDALKNLILSRRSIRAYKSGPVPADLIEQLLNVSVHAGTASNLQGIQFSVVQEPSLLIEIEDLVIENLWGRLKKIGNPILGKLARLKYGDSFAGYYRYYQVFKKNLKNGKTRGMILRGAPAVIVVHSIGKEPIRTADCAIATSNMTLMAQILGLGVCWMGFIIDASLKDPRIKAILDIPKSRNILSCITVGYPKYTYKKSIPRKPPEINWM